MQWLENNDEVVYFDSKDSFLADSIESFTLSKSFSNKESQYHSDDQFQIRRAKFYQTVELINEFDRNQEGSKIESRPVLDKNCQENFEPHEIEELSDIMFKKHV